MGGGLGLGLSSASFLCWTRQMTCKNIESISACMSSRFHGALASPRLQRATKCYVVLHCHAIPSTIIESKSIEQDAIWLHAYSIRRQHDSGKHDCYQAGKLLQCNTARCVSCRLTLLGLF